MINNDYTIDDITYTLSLTGISDNIKNWLLAKNISPYASNISIAYAIITNGFSREFMLFTVGEEHVGK